MEETPRPSVGFQFALRLVGAALLAAIAAVHLDLYLTGYRHIPTIGWLFLLQIIVAFALAVAVLVVRNPLAAVAGAGFAIATLGGYLLTLWIGLFGFQEVRTTAGLVAGLLEIVAFGVLGYSALTGLTGGAAAAVTRLRSGLPGGASTAMAAAATMAGLSVVALVVLGISLGTASGSGGTGSGSVAVKPGSGPVVKIIIKNFLFKPDNPSVKPGQKIEVTNEDAITHTLTAGPSGQDKGMFTTGDVGPNQTKIIAAPQQAGMYAFYCTIHTFMTGMLIVGK